MQKSVMCPEPGCEPHVPHTVNRKKDNIWATHLQCGPKHNMGRGRYDAVISRNQISLCQREFQINVTVSANTNVF
jgi:hypothetical protein